MSRKNSRCGVMSQRNSRCSSVEPLDILEEEPEFKHFINRQEVLAEDEFEDEDGSQAKPEQRNRRVSTASSNFNSQCPSRTWSRRSSPTRGELLRADDEMVTVSRGGMTMTIPRHLAHHVPPVLIGKLDDEGRELCDQMCKQGYTPEEIVEFFKTWVSSRMKIERYMKTFMEQGHRASDKDKMRMIMKLMDGKNMSERDFLDLINSQFGDAGKAELERLMKSGMTMQEAMEAFMKSAETKEKEELKAKLQKILENTNMTKEEKFQAMLAEMSDEDKAKIQAMLDSGMSMNDVLKHFTGEDNLLDMDGNNNVPAGSDFAKKFQELLNGKNLSEEEMMALLRSQLGTNSKKEMEEMLKQGYTMQQILEHFMKNGKTEEEEQQERGGSDFAKKFKEMFDGKNMSEEEMLEALRNQLGINSKKEMEEMLKQGYTMQQILEHFMKNGKTEEEEQKETLRKIQEAFQSGNMSTEDKFNFLQKNLSDDAKATMEQLLKQGYTMEEIIELFKKHGNDIAGLDSELANQTIEFDAEGPDAHLYANRDVFTVISKDDITAKIPFMTPKNQPCSFKRFIETVKSVVAGKGLTHREILDIMEFRMGGSFLADMRSLRKAGHNLPHIVSFFLKKDVEKRQETRRLTRLLADAKVDAHIELRREAIKQQWGIQLSYTYSDENGLHLVLVGVDEAGPAWCSGIRTGDVIVTVNDWLITAMDRPHVAMHLLQAGANEVKLGIQKPGLKGTNANSIIGVL